MVIEYLSSLDEIKSILYRGFSSAGLVIVGNSSSQPKEHIMAIMILRNLRLYGQINGKKIGKILLLSKTIFLMDS